MNPFAKHFAALMRAMRSRPLSPAEQRARDRNKPLSTAARMEIAQHNAEVDMRNLEKRQRKATKRLMESQR